MMQWIPPSLTICSHNVKISNLESAITVVFLSVSFRMVGATDIAVLTHERHVAQALLDVDAPVDRDYVKSDENRTQTFNCEQQSHKQGQKCLLNNNYI